MKAAAAGNCVAEMNIGGLYFNDDGVPQDRHQAESWFAKAQSCKGEKFKGMEEKLAHLPRENREGPAPQR